MIIDGEAPETDDEMESEKEEDKKQIVENRKPVPVDKNLQKHWNQAGSDLINLNNRRMVNQNKQISKIVDQASNCFTNMQNVSSQMNTIHENLTRLEDSVADLIEAFQLLPASFTNSPLDIPNLY